MTKRFIRLKEMQPDLDVEYTPSPDYRAKVDSSLGFGPFRTRTDSDGFIKTGNNFPNHSRSLFFLGASFVESLYAHEATRFVSALERLFYSEGSSIRCLNGGYSGATSLQLMNVVINKIAPLAESQDWVIFFVPQSDADSVLTEHSYWNANQRSTPVLPGKEPPRPFHIEGVEATRAILRLTGAAARELKINLAFATGPFKESEYLEDPVLQSIYSTERKFNRAREVRFALNEVTRETAQELGVALLDVSINQETKYFYDEVHLNESGQGEYARRLEREIRNNLATDW
jgi:lysophospholipase L1-like esterase